MGLLEKIRSARVAAPGTPPSPPLSELVTRHSSGLVEMVRVLNLRESVCLLDLGVTSPTNITFFTDLGYKVYSEDVLAASTDPALRTTDAEGNPAVDAERFLAASLLYPEDSFDAVLCWDLADFMEEGLVRPVVQRLWASLKPGGVMLAFFHSREAESPCGRYHVVGKDSLVLRPLAGSAARSGFRLERSFHNRHIENLFHDFSSVKFFLARDHLREVLVVR